MARADDPKPGPQVDAIEPTARKSSLLVIFLTVFIDLLGFGMVLPLLPIYAAHFAEHLGEEQGGWRVGLLVGLLMASFSLMQFFFAPLWGRLSDRIGRRPVILIGLAGSVLFYAIFGIATQMKSISLLFISRVGAGIAGATISTTQAYIADSTTLEGRARGMALIGAAFGLGFTFGPLFGYLALPSGRGDPGPGPGYAAAALSAVALALAYFRLPESLRTKSRVEPRRWLDLGSLRSALASPPLALLLAAIFISIFAFASFESTLSLLITDEQGAYRFGFKQVCLTFAYIGAVLTLVQGGVVRRIAGRVSESILSTSGALIQIAGFLLLAFAYRQGTLSWLLIGLAVIVTGFALVTPSLNSLLSRWSDPARQGATLGVGQSVATLARILAPMVALPLFKTRTLGSSIGFPSAVLPLLMATVLMCLGLVLIVLATRRGRDFVAEPGDLAG